MCHHVCNAVLVGTSSMLHLALHLLQTGRKVGKALNQHLMEQLREEEKMGRKKPLMGFLR